MQLTAAFEQFNRMSESLIAAYNGLQRQLAQLSERLTVLMSALPAGVLVVAPNGTIAQANPAAEALLGNDLEGQSWARISGRLELAPSAGEAAVRVGADCRRLAISHTRIPASDEHLILLHDITENHRMRQAAERHERLAAMGEMVAGLAHQVRTPLAAALLYVGSMRRAEVSASDRILMVARTEERLQYLERLIGDMLHFARAPVQSGDGFPATPWLSEVIRTLEPLAQARGVAVQWQGPAVAVQLSGDRQALAGALTNVLENALQAAAPGGWVGLHAHATAGQLCLRVTDSGPGIPDDCQARVFEPFFTTRPEGTGLGLAIARSVARAHGGDLTCAAPTGRGAVFELRLPLAAPGGRPAAPHLAVPPP